MSVARSIAVNEFSCENYIIYSIILVPAFANANAVKGLIVPSQREQDTYTAYMFTYCVCVLWVEETCSISNNKMRVISFVNQPNEITDIHS